MKTKILMTAILASVVMTAANAQGHSPRERPDFSRLDANGDGSLTLEEMQARGAARFAEVDTDGDGALSQEELIASASARAAERVAGMLERFDANDDGMLQQSEMPQRGGDRAARMFERVDTDGDGAISEAEFQAAQDRMRDHKGPRNRG